MFYFFQKFDFETLEMGMKNIKDLLNDHNGEITQKNIHCKTAVNSLGVHNSLFLPFAGTTISFKLQ
jgi:hypothetical protein